MTVEYCELIIIRWKQIFVGRSEQWIKIINELKLPKGCVCKDGQIYGSASFLNPRLLILKQEYGPYTRIPHSHYHTLCSVIFEIWITTIIWHNKLEISYLREHVYICTMFQFDLASNSPKTTLTITLSVYLAMIYVDVLLVFIIKSFLIWKFFTRLCIESKCMVILWYKWRQNTK